MQRENITVSSVKIVKELIYLTHMLLVLALGCSPQCLLR